MFVVFALLFHSIKSFCPTRTKELIRNKNYRRQKTNLIPKTVFLRNKMIFVPKPICISTMVVRKVVYGKITVNFVRRRMFYKITTMEICMQKSYDFYFILFIFRKLQRFLLCISQIYRAAYHTPRGQLTSNNTQANLSPFFKV